MRFVESAELRLVDKSSKQLIAINREFRKLGIEARKLKRDLAGLAMPTLSRKGLGVIERSLAAQRREAVATSHAIDKLGTSYASAAAKAQRFGASAASVTHQLHALIGAAGQAKALGRINIGGNLLSGPGGGRRVQGKEKTYSAHLYANPVHSIGNAALSGMFGHNLTLGQALAITAAGSVVVKATHVALEGAKEMSTAHERLFQKGMTPEYMSWADREAHRVSAKYKDTSVQDNLETLNDIGAAVHDRAGQAQLMELLARRQQLMVGQGQDSKEVRDSNVRLIKTLEMSGSLVDQNGHFNAERTNAMLTMIQGVEAVEGRNIDARQIQQAFKYLRENAITQTIDNLRNVLFLGSEVGGSSAGTGFNQAIRNLSGSASKGALKNAAALGLGTATYGERGKLEKYQVNDEEMLRSNFGGWIEKNLMPKIKAAGIDPKTDAATLSKFLGKIVSDRTAKDALMKWITQLRESANKAMAASLVKTDEETAIRAPERDYTAAMTALEKQMSSAAGDIGKKVKGLFIPQVNAAASIFTDLSKVLSGTATDADKGNLVKGGVGAAGLGALGLYAGSKALSLFNPLTGAATALTGSATALTGAAAALSGAAGVTGAGGLGGAIAQNLVSRSLWQIAGRTFAVAAGGYLVERLGEAWLEKLFPDTGKKVRAFREGAENEAVAKAGDAVTVLTGGSLAEVKVQQLTQAQRLRGLNDEALGLQKRLSDLGDAYGRDRNGTASKAIETETADILKRLERNARLSTETTAKMALENFGVGGNGYGAVGGAPSPGAAGGPGITLGGFTGGATYESALAKFSETVPSTITGLKEAAAQFEQAGAKMGADLGERARESLTSSWGDAVQALKSGGDAVAASIRGALAGGVAVHMQKVGPSTGSASPVKQ